MKKCWIECFAVTEYGEMLPLPEWAERQESPLVHRAEASCPEVFTKWSSWALRSRFRTAIQLWAGPGNAAEKAQNLEVQGEEPSKVSMADQPLRASKSARDYSSLKCVGLSTADLNEHFEAHYGTRHLQDGLTSRMNRRYSRLSIYRSSRNNAKTKT